MAADDIIIDQYAALSHKAGLHPAHLNIDLIPNWLPTLARRRLTSYRILDSYLSNIARHLAQLVEGPSRADEIREFGDPRVLVNRIVAGVVGTDPQLRIADMDNPPPPHLTLGDQPPDPASTEDPTLRAAYEAQQAVWRATVERDTAEYQQRWQQWPTVVDADRWLSTWQDKIRYSAKVYESEATSTVPLGDGVLVLGVEDGSPWPTLTVYEPDAYHPVLDASNTDEYPSKVHLAWEYIDDDDHRKLRRITYELVDLPEPRTSPWGTPRTQTCLMTDKTWDLSILRGGWASLDPDRGIASTVISNGAEVVVDEMDLLIDWIPILHLPNTPSTQTHFGRSSIATVAQIFDSVSAVDTDIERAAAIAGLPIMGHTGDTPPTDMKLRPGMILSGQISAIDLSASLGALRALQDDLLDRLAVNSEVPGVVLGRVDPSAVASGVALAIMHNPFDTLVSMLRLTRTHKYPMLGKWAMRWAQLRGDLEPGETPTVEAVFPDVGIRDVVALVGWLAQAVQAGLISRTTATAVLQQNGVPIEDLDTELARVRVDDVASAVAVADATGSEAAAAARLGIDLAQFTTPTTRLEPDTPPRL